MKGKEIKGRTRIACPLCGSLAWQSQFEKKKPLLRMLTQWSPGFRQFRYQENKQPEMLQHLRMYLIGKVEELYEKLTGISIPELLKRAGGELKWSSSKDAWIRIVPSTFGWKTDGLSNSPKINVTESVFLKTLPKK